MERAHGPNVSSLSLESYLDILTGLSQHRKQNAGSQEEPAALTLPSAGTGGVSVLPVSKMEEGFYRMGDLKQVLAMHGLALGTVKNRRELLDKLVGTCLMSPVTIGPPVHAAAAPDHLSGQPPAGVNSAPSSAAAPTAVANNAPVSAAAPPAPVLPSVDDMLQLGWVTDTPELHSALCGSAMPTINYPMPRAQVPAHAGTSVENDTGHALNDGGAFAQPRAVLHVGRADAIASDGETSAQAPTQHTNNGGSATQQLVPALLPPALPAGSTILLPMQQVVQRVVPAVLRVPPQLVAVALVQQSSSGDGEQACGGSWETEATDGEKDMSELSEAAEEAPPDPALAWLKPEIDHFAADHSSSDEELACDGALLGRRVAFLLLQEFEHTDAHGQVEQLPCGVYQGRITELLGSSCQPELCESGCPGPHSFCYARLLLRLASGRLDLKLDLHARHRCMHLSQLAAIQDVDVLQDAWVLLKLHAADGDADTTLHTTPAACAVPVSLGARGGGRAAAAVAGRGRGGGRGRAGGRGANILPQKRGRG